MNQSETVEGEKTEPVDPAPAPVAPLAKIPTRSSKPKTIRVDIDGEMPVLVGGVHVIFRGGQVLSDPWIIRVAQENNIPLVER